MSDLFTKIAAWIKANTLISILIGIVVLFMVTGHKLGNLLGGKRKVRHHRTISRTAPRRRSLPRSVSMHKVKRSNKAAYNKNGSKKKPWQIAGSLAARRHMAEIRRKR